MPASLPTASKPDLQLRIVTVELSGMTRVEWTRHDSFDLPDGHQAATREPMAAMTSFIPASTEIQEMELFGFLVAGKASQKGRTRMRAREFGSRMTMASREGKSCLTRWLLEGG